MTIKEFFNLNYWEASKVFRKAIGKRIGSYENLEDIKKSISAIITDLSWGSMDMSFNNASLEILNKWYVTRLRLVFTFRYNNEIAIKYYVGNTNDSCTLKEISYAGIGTYWKDNFPDLEKLGLYTSVSIKIPEIKYENGRKGTISDLLNKKYNLLKLKLDFSIGTISRILSDGSFIDSWKNIGDTYTGSDLEACNNLDGVLGDALSSLISDNSQLSMDDLVLYIKSISRNFSEFNEADTLIRYFNRGYCKYDGLSKTQLQALKDLKKKILRKSKISEKIIELEGILQQEIDKVYDSFAALNPDLGLSSEILKDILKTKIQGEIKYKYLC